MKFAVARCSAGSRLALRAPASGGCELDPVRSPGFLASMRSAPCARPRRRRGPAPDLPSDTLPYLRPSRYCDTELLADFAWANFNAASGEWARVQAICDFVHQRLRFSSPPRRVQHGLQAKPWPSGSASAATSRIWRWPCAAVSIFRRATATAISATSASRPIQRLWTSTPGSKPFSAIVGSLSTRGTNGRGSAAS